MDVLGCYLNLNLSSCHMDERAARGKLGKPQGHSKPPKVIRASLVVVPVPLVTQEAVANTIWQEANQGIISLLFVPVSGPGSPSLFHRPCILFIFTFVRYDPSLPSSFLPRC